MSASGPIPSLFSLFRFFRFFRFFAFSLFSHFFPYPRSSLFPFLSRLLPPSC